MIEALLSLSRMTSKRARSRARQPVADRRRTDVDDLRRAGPRARGRVRDRAQLLRADGDRRYCGSCCENLLGNAWKFTAQRRERAHRVRRARRSRSATVLRARQRRRLRHALRRTAVRRRSSACTAPASSRAPASASPPCRRSSAATAAASGPKRPRARRGTRGDVLLHAVGVASSRTRERLNLYFGGARGRSGAQPTNQS